jgi:ArsR family transcriptional regulator
MPTMSRRTGSCATIPTRLDVSGRACRPGEEAAAYDDLALVAKALSDPIRLGMLDVMTQGRGCCGFADPATRGVPGSGEPQGICVCEFQERFGLGQSKASYHLRVLRDAGLVVEETRGKWSFYAVHAQRVAQALGDLCALMNARLEGCG